MKARLGFLIAAVLLLMAAANTPPQILYGLPGAWTALQAFHMGAVHGPWTTSTRPASPVVGLTGFNSTIGAEEHWNGSAWVTVPASQLSGLGTGVGSALGQSATGTGGPVLASAPSISQLSLPSQVNTMAQLARDAFSDNVQINPPMSVPAWTANYTYATGDKIGYTSGSTTIYFEEQFGPTCVSANSGSGPTSVSAATFITDGTCLWLSTQIIPTNNAPTITPASYWAPGTAFPAGAATVTFTNTSAPSSAAGNFFTTSSGGTSAPAVASASTSSASGTNLTLGGTITGTFAPGQYVEGTGITPNTVYIVSQSSGTTGGGGVYVTNQSTTATGAVTAASFGPQGTSTFVDGTITWTYQSSFSTNQYSNLAKNSFNWYGTSGGNGNLPKIANFYGGTQTTDGVSGYLALKAATIQGTLATAASRVEFLTNAAKFVIRTSGPSASENLWRLIVCDKNGMHCQYASPNHYGGALGGFMSTLVDFSTVGGKATRDIIVESQGPGDLGGIDILATDDAWPPNGLPVLTMGAICDSYPIGGGVQTPMVAYPQIAADLLGIRNVINTAIGGTGYLITTGSGAPPPSGSGTAIQRISDIENINGGNGPDILLISCGTNDAGVPYSPSQIAAAQTAYIAAIRANAPTAHAPIFVLGIYAHNNGGTSCSTCVNAENAEQAAIVNDGLTFFCPWTTDPAGAWETGTGSISSQNASGNTDYTYETVGVHPNAMGNKTYAARLAACVRKNLSALHY